MKLFSYQPKGHGSRSFFVMATDDALARHLVTTEIRRLMELPLGDPNRLDSYDVSGWGTDYYSAIVAAPGEVLSHNND